MPDEKHFYQEVREAVDAVVVAFEDHRLTYLEAVNIGREAYEAASHFTEAMRDDDEHFAHLLEEVNRAIADAWEWIDKKTDVPWAPDAVEEVLFGSAAAMSQWLAAKLLRERRAQIIGG